MDIVILYISIAFDRKPSINFFGGERTRIMLFKNNLKGVIVFSSFSVFLMVALEISVSVKI